MANYKDFGAGWGDYQVADPTRSLRNRFVGQLENLTSPAGMRTFRGLENQMVNAVGTTNMYAPEQSRMRSELKRTGPMDFYQNALKDLTNRPGSLENLGSYKFALSQGMDAINRKAAALGTSLGSGTAKDLGNYASGLASQTYFDMYGALQQSLAGATDVYGARTGAATGAYGQALQGYGARVGAAQGAYSTAYDTWANRVGLTKGLAEGNALELKKLQAQERLGHYSGFKSAKASKKASGGSSGWGQALGAVVGAGVSLL
jgi:hypothetical protein